jgi:hypothetical protein
VQLFAVSPVPRLKFNIISDRWQKTSSVKSCLISTYHKNFETNQKPNCVFLALYEKFFNHEKMKRILKSRPVAVERSKGKLGGVLGFRRK